MPIVDVRFRLHGALIPADHGYLLFAALSRIVPALHGDNAVGVHPVSGQLSANRCLRLTSRSFLTLRLDADRIREFLPVAGKSLLLGGHQSLVGVPEPRGLAPTAQLYSRLVVIKGFMEPEAFLEATERQLHEMGVKGRPSLIPQPEVERANADGRTGSHSPFLRRTLKIRDKEVVGFALMIEELDAEDSMRVQESGIGGRRRFGCGVFVPYRR